jgi:hypothetical protein
LETAEERARVAGGPGQRARAQGRVRQRGRVARRGAGAADGCARRGRDRRRSGGG